MVAVLEEPPIRINFIQAGRVIGVGRNPGFLLFLFLFLFLLLFVFLI